MKIQWKNLITCIAIPLAVGSLASLLTRNSMATFNSITKPGLAVSGCMDDSVHSYGNRIISGAYIRKAK